jgi:Flp pilus assembly protein TadG
MKWFAGPWEGQVLLLAALLLSLLLSVIGLMVDGGTVLIHRRELQNTADAAARAGATQLNETVFRSSGGRRAVLDRARARAEANHYLRTKAVRGTMRVTDRSVAVVVHQSVDLAFLELLGLHAVEVDAEAEATLEHGVERPEGR